LKKTTIFHKIFLPIWIILLLLPILSCLIFFTAAKYAAYQTAKHDLKSMQEKLVPLIEESFSAIQNKKSTEERDPIKTFQKRITHLISQTGGYAKVAILAGQDLQIIYPRDEEIQEEIAPLLDSVLQSLSKNETDILNGTSALRATDEKDYFVNVYKVSLQTNNLRYIIAYCPISDIGAWISQANTLFLIISVILMSIVFLLTWLSMKSITNPVNQLCNEAKRIGEGDFSQIESEFSLDELDELRNSMNMMLNRLQHTDENQKRFFQDISHELRNPLMSISGYAQGIEQKVFPSDQEAAHIILKESQRLTNLVNQLLTLSRIESNISQQVTDPVCVADVLDCCIDRIRGITMKNNISVRIPPFSSDIIVQGSEEMLEKVLENLLSNAARYASTEILICVKKAQDSVIISVADDGCGIAPEDIPHVFERCYIGQNGRYGIGLSIAQSAAKKMNSRISVQNKKPCGALFELRMSPYVYT